jgi:hypothetical protein
MPSVRFQVIANALSQGRAVLFCGCAMLAGAAADEPAPPPVPAEPWYALPDNLDVLLAEPAVNLPSNAPVWMRRPPGKPAANAGKPHQGWKQSGARKDLLDWHSTALSVDVARLQPGSRELSEAASVKLNLRKMSVNADLKASAGSDAANTADLWHKRVAEVEMKMLNLPKTQVSVTGGDEFSLVSREPSSLGDTNHERHILETDTRSAGVVAAVNPVDGVGIDVGETTRAVAIQDTTASDRTSEINSTVQTAVQDSFVRLTLQPDDWLKLETEAHQRNSGISWRAQTARQSTYRSFEPRAALSVDFGDTKVRTSVERTAATYNSDAFVAYAKAAEPTETLPVEPDHAWQFKTEASRRIGFAELSAAYTASRDGTTTEYAVLGSGAQAPASTALKRRDELAVKLTLPLGPLGLTNTSLSSNAVWSASQVLDPVTGDLRRASGEIPTKLSLRLERQLPLDNLHFGLTGELTGSKISYQTRQITQVAPGDSLGLFLAYKPGAYVLDLNVDGLTGTPRTVDYLYSGIRNDRLEPTPVVHDALGPTLKLSLSKNF